MSISYYTFRKLRVKLLFMLNYDVRDVPTLRDTILCALQHFLAVINATIIVPTVLNLQIQIPAAILGAGLGTLIYVLITRRKSPIFLSSNFAFIPSIGIAITFGYLGIIIGVLFASLIYIVASIVIHFVGTKWLDKMLPPAIIGPIVVLIGLSLATNCTEDIARSDVLPVAGQTNFVALLIALISFFVVVICATQNKRKGIKLIPFVFGITTGFVISLIFTAIGKASGNTYIQIFDFNHFHSMFIKDNGEFKGITAFFDYPRISLIEAIKEIANGDVGAAIKAINPNASFVTPIGVAEIALAFIPVAFVGFAEHIADHKNMSYFLGHDLLEDPGLSRTLMGDGLGSVIGTLFGICPNTTYGQSIACVAQSKNASVLPVILASIFCIFVSFCTPLNALFACIPSCVMAGVCIALYGYITLSGLNVLQKVNFNDEKVMFTTFAILIVGVGGLVLRIPLGNNKFIDLSSFACALLLGILTYNLTKFVQEKAGEKSEK